MIEREPSVWEKGLEIFFKILLPALVGVSIKIAIRMQREKITIAGVLLSYVIGIGCAWLASPFIVDAVSFNYVPMMIAIVAISGDKIGEWLIYRFNVDAFMNALMVQARVFIIGMFTPKQNQ